MGATIGAACVAGTASVVIGTTSILTGRGEIGLSLAGSLMAAANAGEKLYSDTCLRLGIELCFY